MDGWIPEISDEFGDFNAQFVDDILSRRDVCWLNAY